MTGLLERLAEANPEDVSVNLDLPAVERDLAVMRRGRRRRTTASLVVVAGIFVALFVGSLPHSGKDIPLAVGAAQAASEALEPGKSIVHVVIKIRQRDENGPQPERDSEMWIGPGGSPVRVRDTEADGTVLSDVVLPPGANNVGSPDPLYVAKEMLRNGTLRSLGTAIDSGREVERFANADNSLTWDFDADDFSPVRSRLRTSESQGALTVDRTFLVYERLQSDDSNRKLLRASQSGLAERPLGRPHSELFP